MLATLALALAIPAAHDVTTSEGRRQNLLEYVASRDDLDPAARDAWSKAIRKSFGGKALKDGTDEGVTAAKSVIAGAIFFDIEPARGAKAAYECYHDTYRWVPPPIAVNYQLLSFQGRAPRASPRELAFDFPRYFNSDLAPELVAWWDERLRSGALPAEEAKEVRRVLRATRDRMGPMLLEQLWLGVELEARREQANPSDRREVEGALADLARELASSFTEIARDPAVYAAGPYYPRYRAMAAELGVKPSPLPPGARRDASRAQLHGPPRARPKPPEPGQSLGFATVSPPAAPSRPGDLLPAPLPGDALIRVPPDYVAALRRTVESWVGTPYLWGGTTRSGVDCSAFVRNVYNETFAVELPRNSRAQAALGRAISLAELEPGDLVFFDTLERGRISHVGVYLGDGALAHASSRLGVTRAELEKPYYQRAYRGSRRILEAR